MRKPKPCSSIWLILGAILPCQLMAQPGPFLAADLQFAYQICSDTTFDFLDIEVGDVADLGPATRGCLVANERNGLWTTFSMETSGRIGFVLSSSLPQTDIDFAVWGPFSEWMNLLSTQPIRCSYASIAGPTGVGGTATDASEAAGGDGWVSFLDVNMGDRFILYVDNSSFNGADVQLVWDLQEGATLTCLDPPQVSFGTEGNDILPGGTVNLFAFPEPEVFAYYWELPGSTIGTSLDQNPQNVQYEVAGCYDVSLTMYNAGGQNTATTPCMVNVLLPTAVEDAVDIRSIEYDGLGVSVHLTSTDEYHVSVVDLLGRTLETRTGSGRQYISLENQASNVVLIIVKQGTTRHVHRLMLR